MLASFESVSGSASAHLSIGAIGITPFISAFIVVEILALLIPAWRRLRTACAEDRGRLTRAAMLLGGGLALVQGWTVARNVASMTYFGHDILLLPPSVFEAIAALTLAASSVTLTWVALQVDRRGLGSGFSVLIAAGLILEDAPVARQLIAEVLTGGIDTAHVLVLLISVAAGGWLIVAFLTGRRPFSTEVRDGMSIPNPASGLAPLTAGATMVMLPFLLRSFGASGALAEWLDSFEGRSPLWLQLVLLVPWVILFGWAFNTPDRLLAVHARARGPGEARPTEASAVRLVQGAILRSAIFLLMLMVARDQLIGSLHPGIARLIDVSTFVVLVAIALDVADDWAAFGAHEALASVWPEHRPYAVPAALRALEAKGIEAWTRGRHHRALLQFFGPYVPVEILVPVEKREEALEVLRSVLG
jgi:hypothetical protein